MINKKNHKQLDIVDPWFQISNKRRRRLHTEWPGLFQRELLTELPVDELAASFHKSFGAPTKELYSILGAILLQQMHDLTDRETIDQLAFNTQWHYALNIPEESDQIKYVSEKTWWSMRQLATAKHLDKLMLDRITAKLARVFKVKTDDQRIDSVHIKSNMRKLSRLGVFSRAIHRFLINLKRHQRGCFDKIDPAVRSRYLKKKALDLFAMVKPSQTAKTLAQVSTDLYDLIEQFKDHSGICNMNSYKLMQRVLSEQCHIHPEASDRRVTVKKPSEVPADSLQNPSDPDAGYSGHKGQGYQVQIMESYNRHKNKDPANEHEEPALNLITHVAVEKACDHDKHALLPAIEAAADKGLKPTTVLADSLYGSDANVTAAEKEAVSVVSPVMKGGNPKKISLSDFRFDDNGCVNQCPQQHSPERVKHKRKRGRYSIGFGLDHCLNCSHLPECPVQVGRKQAYLRYGARDVRLVQRRKHESTDDFRDHYRWRAGVEATMSQLSRLTGIKQQRVRGMPAVRFSSTLKALGVNILRAAAAYRAAASRRKGASGTPFTFFKEQISAYLPIFRYFYHFGPIYAHGHQKLAA